MVRGALVAGAHYFVANPAMLERNFWHISGPPCSTGRTKDRWMTFGWITGDGF